MQSIPIIAASIWSIAIWVAVAVVFVASMVVAYSRWAQRRPLARCVLLSLAAHAVLVAIAATIRFVSLPPGAGLDEPVRVTIVAMAPEPSIKAPDARAATAEPPAEEIPEVVSPEQPESPPTEAVDSTPPRPEAEPLTAPELAPDPTPTPEKQTEADKIESEKIEAPGDVVAQATGPAVQETPVEQTGPSASAEAAAEVQTKPVAQESPQQPETQPVPPAADVTPARPALPSSLTDRIRPDRLQSVVEQGGSRETEQAVARALEWLANSQSSDGRWDADRWQAGREFVVLGHNRRGAGGEADTAVTGLALLTFLGAGHTHSEGSYQQQVASGLVFLMRSQDSQGNLAASASFYARTYSHSMATFALAEAYALTGDKRLEECVRRAVGYLLRCENRSFGGWRYNAGDQGDVSQLGWVIMALRSAELAGVEVPDATWQRIDGFLGRVARGRHGGLAAYQARTDWSRAMTAEAMYCRQVLGKPLKDAALGESINALSGEMPGEGLANYYYWYYATLALHHAQRDSSAAAHTWQQWNEQIKHELLAAQVTDGSNAGSWSPNTVWGGYGGRVYTTAMAAMCLEVYYRYGSAAGDGSPWVASRPRGEQNQR